MEIVVDSLKMPDDGQYVYVSVVKGGTVEPGVEPVVKFNNGFDGGSDEVMFCPENMKHPGGPVVAMTEKFVIPAIRTLL